MKHSPSIPISLLAAAVSCAAKAPSPQAPLPSPLQSLIYHSSVIQPDDEDIRQCDEGVDEFSRALAADFEFQCDRERVHFAIGQLLLRCGEMFTPMRADMVRRSVDRRFGRFGNCEPERNLCRSAVDFARQDIHNLANTCTEGVPDNVRKTLAAMEQDCSTAGGRQLAAEQNGVRQALQIAVLQCTVNAMARRLGIEPRN